MEGREEGNKGEREEERGKKYKKLMLNQLLW